MKNKLMLKVSKIKHRQLFINNTVQNQFCNRDQDNLSYLDSTRLSLNLRVMKLIRKNVKRLLRKKMYLSMLTIKVSCHQGNLK